MSQRTKHAIQASIAFGGAVLILYAVFLYQADSVSRNNIPAAVIGVSLTTFFVSAFILWWLVFNSTEKSIWHACYVGWLIYMVHSFTTTFSLFSLVISKNPEALGKLVISFMLIIPSYFLYSLPSTIPSILFAMAIRWLQLRSSTRMG